MPLERTLALDEHSARMSWHARVPMQPLSCDRKVAPSPHETRSNFVSLRAPVFSTAFCTSPTLRRSVQLALCPKP